MPIVPDQKNQILERKLIATPEFDDLEPSFKEIALATFRTENSIGSLISKSYITGLPDNSIDDPDFNPWEHLTDDEKLDEQFFTNAMMADNIDEIESVRKLSTKYRKDRDTIARGGAMSFAVGFGVGGLLDPINFIPIGGTAYKTYKAGASILKGGMITGAVASASTSLQETALHATQMERTFGESALNVSASFLLGGVLGVGAAKLAKWGVTDKTLSEIEDSFNVEAKIRNGEDSVGAARVKRDVKIKGEKLRAVLKKTAFDPLTRSLTSDAPPTRQAASTLAENVYTMDTPTLASVESLAKIWDGKYTIALESNRKLFTDLRVENGTNNLKDKLFRKGVTLKNFNEMVGRELANPNKNAPKQVQAAAKIWRSELYDPLKKEAIEAKLLAKDIEPKTAVNYLNRMWNTNKIAENLDDFILIVSKWLKTEDFNVAGKNIDEQDYEFVAQEIAQRISGTPDGRLPYDWKLGEGSKSFGVSGTKLKGPFQQRTFQIPDELVEKFLERDIELLAGRYYKQVGPDIELTKAFDDVGMEAQLKEVQQWWSDAMRKEKNKKKRIKMNNEMKRDVSDIAGMRDRVRGVYAQPDPNSIFTRILRTTRDLSYLRFMGGVVASSTPDVSRLFMAEGFANTFKFGLKPLITNNRAFKISVAEGKRYNGALSALFGGRGEIIADIADYTKGGTTFERAVRAGAEKFGKVNLMDHWTAAVKQLHAVTMQTSIFEGLSKGKYDKRLDRLGISKDDAFNMWEQVQKHGRKVDGVWTTGAKNWDSPDLEKMWGVAMRKESDRVIVIPGQEKPLFMSREMGKSFMQFKSFMFSATQRVLIAGLQGQDHNFFGGAMSLVGIGMMAYAFKNWDAGRELSDDPTVWVIEGVDRSGLTGILMEINNTVEKISNNNFGLRPLLGVSAPSSRYASRSFMEAMLGPTFGSFAETTRKVLTAASDEREWDQSDTRALRRLLPYQNLSILRQAFDKIEGR